MTNGTRMVLAALTAAGLLVRVLVAGSGAVQDAPGIVMDVVDAWLVWAIVARAAPHAATAAAAFVLFNPALIEQSAARSQLDSLWWGCVLLAVFAGLRLHDARHTPLRLAWLGAGFAVPLGVFASTAATYPYTTVNAFNLYAVRAHFWTHDTTPMAFGFLDAFRIGLILSVVSVALIVVRALDRKDDRSYLEAALLAALAFFLFPTRVHENGITGPLLLSVTLIGFGRRYVVAACALSVTALLNFAYATEYARVTTHFSPGTDTTDLWPAVSHTASLVNLAVLFGLGWFFVMSSNASRAAQDDPVRTAFAGAWARARDWFSPREGMTGMTRGDVALAAAFGAVAFVVSVLWLQYPNEKIFDEVYYPRAAGEYLSGTDLGGHGPYEYTHPPLTKLIIALSMLLFGGLHGGDTTLGWRFLNVVIGALMLPLAYAFAKRLTGSTLAASIAAALLLFDGFRFVQSRIATPEIVVAVLALAVLYAFYRWWTDTAVRVHAVRDRGVYLRTFAAILAVRLAVAGLVAWFAPLLGHRHAGLEWLGPARWAALAYAVAVAYLVACWVAERRGRVIARRTSYPDGTFVRQEGNAAVFSLLDGTTIAGGTNDAQRSGDGWTRRFLADGSEAYDTPEGSARYAPDGTTVLDGATRPRFRPHLWIGALGIACGLLLAAKWNGILDPVVVAGLSAFVVLQRFFKRPALYGNPFGMRLDLLAAWIVAASGAVYLLSYIPYFLLGHNFVDLIELQHAMYAYHHTLNATHPYASPWWQWPLLLKPISYYYATYEPYTTAKAAADCCVAEILALPNPLVWWTGLISVPFVAFLAWKERSRGFLLLATAYAMQWLPWALSPRIAFAYHFFPNLAIIAMCDAVLLHRIWLHRPASGNVLWTRTAVIAYVIAAAALFAFFYPILAGTHIPWDQWRARMWIYPDWV